MFYTIIYQSIKGVDSIRYRRKIEIIAPIKFIINNPKLFLNDFLIDNKAVINNKFIKSIIGKFNKPYPIGPPSLMMFKTEKGIKYRLTKIIQIPTIIFAFSILFFSIIFNSGFCCVITANGNCKNSSGF